MTDLLRHQLTQTRNGMLGLHRALLAAEREAWERLYGRRLGNVEFLKMTISDPWFAWLQPLTALLVEIDELAVDPTPETDAEIPAVLASARALAHPDEDGNDFQQRYFELMQRSADVAVSHGMLVRTFTRV